MLTGNDIVGFLDALRDRPSAQDALRCTETFFATQGLPWLCYGYPVQDKGDHLRVPDLYSNVPDAYVARWVEAGICDHDPGVRHAYARLEPEVFGSEFLRHNDCSPAVYEFYRDLRSIGSYSVLTVPLRNRRRRAAGFIEIGGRYCSAEMRKFLIDNLRLLSLAAYHADERMVELTEKEQAQSVGLTPRESACLQWLAKGKRYDQIADRIGISTPTVRFHLANARRKLKASTPEQAVARAVFLGLVEP